MTPASTKLPRPPNNITPPPPKFLDPPPAKTFLKFLIPFQAGDGGTGGRGGDCMPCMFHTNFLMFQQIFYFQIIDVGSSYLTRLSAMRGEKGMIEGVHVRRYQSPISQKQNPCFYVDSPSYILPLSILSPTKNKNKCCYFLNLFQCLSRASR